MEEILHHLGCKTLWILGYLLRQLVQDFFHQQYDYWSITKPLFGCKTFQQEWNVQIYSHGLLRSVMVLLLTVAQKKGVHPGRLTWNLRIHTWKRKIIFQTIIFMFYFNLLGCIPRYVFNCIESTWNLPELKNEKKNTSSPTSKSIQLQVKQNIFLAINI